MTINQKQFETIQKEAEEIIEICFFLKAATNAAPTENNVSFPNHLSDERLSEVLSKIVEEDISQIIPLTSLSRKLVIF